jgi:hypothetical protein
MTREMLALTIVLAFQVPSASSRETLVVPSRQFQTIQDALDTAPDGAVVRILPGVYRLVEPLWIRNKRLLTIVGGGDDGPNRTELHGPIPGARDPVADPERALGVVNVVDSSVDMSHVLLRGFDAGIVGRQTTMTARGNPVNKFRNIAVRDTGRGILWKARGKLAVSDSRIADVSWNGISLAPEPATVVSGTLLKFNLDAIIIADYANAGIVYVDDPGVCDDEHTINNATLIGGGGPAILAIRSGVCVFDSHIAIPRVAGIVALSAAVLVQRTKIFFPLPTTDGRWGTGIIASAFGSGRSLVTLADNEIKNVEHSFIANMGSDVIFTGNELVCSEVFDLVAGSFLGFGFSFDDGGNPAQCSDECPAQLGLPPLSFRTCTAEPFFDAPPQPPMPIA